MLIFDENNETVIIESRYTPLLSDYCWVLDLEQLDFMLTPIKMLGEVEEPTILVEANDYKFLMPAKWCFLVFDEETRQLDVVETNRLTISNLQAVVYGPKMRSMKSAKIKTLDYRQSVSHVFPVLNKHQMLCHPISPDSWIVISPTDNYGKYLKDKTTGDIF